MSEFYSVGPVAAGAGLNISVLADDRTLSEPHHATDAMIRSFAEIHRTAGLGTQVGEVDSAMPIAHAV